MILQPQPFYFNFQQFIKATDNKGIRSNAFSSKLHKISFFQSKIMTIHKFSSSFISRHTISKQCSNVINIHKILDYKMQLLQSWPETYSAIFFYCSCNFFFVSSGNTVFLPCFILVCSPAFSFIFLLVFLIYHIFVLHILCPPSISFIAFKIVNSVQYFPFFL